MPAPPPLLTEIELAIEQANRNALQDAFNARLTRYVNGGHLGPGDVALSLVSMRLSRIRHASTVQGEYRRLVEGVAPATEDPPRRLRIPPYEGDVPQVHAIQADLAACGDGVRAAFVHGSLASGEIMPYSDFDALVVLRDELFSTHGRLAATAAQLHRARRRMIALDPLQHHGWFVLTEWDLAHYPESHLPLAALERGRSLLGGEQVLEVKPRVPLRAAYESLFGLTAGLLAQCSADSRPRDLYRAKSFLSRFMLLPAVYLQARHGTGVYKGDSFAAARPDFPAWAWRAMDRASAIRSEWDYPLTPGRRTVLGASLVARPFLLRHLAPPLPSALAAKLDDEFYRGVAALVRLLRDQAKPPGEDERLAP